jgi:hypothetical protein
VRRRVITGAPARRLSLKEQVESFLGQWTPTRDEIEKERLVAMGGDYIDRAGEAA